MFSQGESRDHEKILDDDVFLSFLRLPREGFGCFTILFVQRLTASHRGITHKSKTEVSCESANKTGPLLVVRLRSLTNYRVRLDLFVL